MFKRCLFSIIGLLLTTSIYAGTLSVRSSSDSLTLVSNQTFNDDVLLQFGTGGTVHCLYETADGNANLLLCTTPEGGGTDVPVFVWGDVTAENADLGLFNGITSPSIAVLSDDALSYVYLTHDQTNSVIVNNEGDLMLDLAGGNLAPSANDGSALGISGTAWADLFLATGGVINFFAGDVTATHSANTLAFAGASSGYTFDANVALSVAGNPLTLTNNTDNASVQAGIVQGDRATPADNDAAYLALRLSDSAGNQDEGARITWQATTVADGATQDTDLIFSTVVNNVLTTFLTLDGSASQIVPSVAINAAGITSPDLGTVTTIDINGGTLDGVTIGGAAAAAATVTALTIDVTGVSMDTDADGAITFLGLGDGFDENLILNLDDTENVGTFTSSTALATLNFSSIALQESGVAVLNNDEIDSSSELIAIIDDETGSGLVVFGTSPTLVTADITLATTSGLTASTTQSQGQQALTSVVNEVAVCANANDVVTLPAAAIGKIVYIFNNGAQTLQVFPASDDAIDGAAANTSVSQGAGANITYIAHDTTNWNRIHSPL